MRRIITAVAVAAALAATTAAPAEAAGKAPKLNGSWTCASSAGGDLPLATVDFSKGNKYAANGDTEKGKYVYKVGQQKIKFKTGVWADYFYGAYDKETKTFTLVNVADDTAAGVCSRVVAP